MESPSEPHQQLDALLGEADWVLRIARSLVRDEHAARDLSQDVMGDAIAAPPNLRGERLRAWLWTIARRRASRQRSREQNRPRVEAQAAAPEATAPDSSADRLELHVDLAREIQELDPEDRNVLVGFFLEGRSQKEIAKSLGCTPVAVRKRVARAKDRLRRRLDASPRGRDGWTAGLIVLAFPGGVPAGVMGAADPAAFHAVQGAAPAAIPALPLFAMKLALLTLAAVVVAGFAAVHLLDSSGERTGLVRLELSPAATSSGSTGTDGRSPIADVFEAEVVGRAEVAAASPASETAAATSAARFVHIMTEAQEPLPDAKVVWLTDDGALTVTPLDDAGVGAIASTQGGRLFAAAPGYLGRMVRLEAAAAVETVVLRAAHVLEGRVTVDGVAPGRSLAFRQWQLGRDMELGGRFDPTLERMRELLGIKPDGSRWLQTDENGTFAFELEWQWKNARFWRPKEFVVRSLDSEEIARGGADLEFALDGRLHRVDLLQLPAVRGRLVWSDDLSPVSGSVWYLLEKEDGNSSMTSGFLDPDGRFNASALVGSHDFDPPRLDLERMEIGGEPIAIVKSLRIWLGEERVDLGKVWSRERDGYPLDLGDIRVDRHRKLQVIVRSRVSGEPLDASVVGSAKALRTGADGMAHVAVEAGQPLKALAMGYGYSSFDVTAAQIEQGLPVIIELDPAPVLVIRGPAGSPSEERAEEPLMVRLSFDRTPFATAELDENECGYSYDFALQRSLQGSGFFGGGWSHSKPGAPGYVDYELPGSGDLRIGGLILGSSFTVRCTQGEESILPDREVKLVEGETVIELGR